MDGDHYRRSGRLQERVRLGTQAWEDAKAVHAEPNTGNALLVLTQKLDDLEESMRSGSKVLFAFNRSAHSAGPGERDQE